MNGTVSIVGAGRVGRTLARRLRELGWRIGAVVTRSPATSRAAVHAIGAGSPSVRLTHKVLEADVVLLAVPDAAYEAVALALARLGGKSCGGKIVLHTSGALGRSVLVPLARFGASTGSLHPMQTFIGRAMPKLSGVTFAVEGDRRALRAARQISAALGAVPVALKSAEKPAYHAAGVLVAGHALALVEAATRVLLRLGFSRRRVREALLPLTRQMLENFERLGPRASWTGPVARGDYAVVAMHMNALRPYPREFRQSYAALARLGARVLSSRPGATIRRLDRSLKTSMRGKR